MNVLDILNIVDGTLINNFDTNRKINKVKIDSRKVIKNDLFVCVKGINDDGHKYIDSIKNIASAIIIDRNVNINNIYIPVIMVNNTIDALAKIASHIRKMYDIPLIAITGSVGKTTTKELISYILESKYKVLKTIGNYNNHIGLPMTLMNLNDTYDLIVTEMGMNHLGEIEKLSMIAKPNTCIITNIGTSHIGNLKNRDNIFKAKMEIVKGMNNGDLLVNSNDDYLNKLYDTKNYHVIKCGYNDVDELYAYDIKCMSDKTLFKININNNEYQVVFNIPGRHLIPDVLLAITCSIKYNIDIETIINRVSSFKGTDNRMEIMNIFNNNILISDTYNSSYESLSGALDVIDTYQKNKLIILGDILEIGDYKNDIYKKIEVKLQNIKNKTLFLVGTDIINITGDYKFKNVNELLDYIKTLNVNDCVILIKGSNKVNLNLISEYLKNINII